MTTPLPVTEKESFGKNYFQQHKHRLINSGVGLQK